MEQGTRTASILMDQPLEQSPPAGASATLPEALHLQQLADVKIAELSSGLRQAELARDKLRDEVESLQQVVATQQCHRP